MQKFHIKLCQNYVVDLRLNISSESSKEFLHCREICEENILLLRVFRVRVRKIFDLEPPLTQHLLVEPFSSFDIAKYISCIKFCVMDLIFHQNLNTILKLVVFKLFRRKLKDLVYPRLSLRTTALENCTH